MERYNWLIKSGEPNLSASRQEYTNDKWAYLPLKTVPRIWTHKVLKWASISTRESVDNDIEKLEHLVLSFTSESQIISLFSIHTSLPVWGQIFTLWRNWHGQVLDN